MRLIVNGASLSITQMGPDFLFVESATSYAPCQATIVLQVDDSQRQWRVRLPEGISKASKRVALALREQDQEALKGRKNLAQGKRAERLPPWVGRKQKIAPCPHACLLPTKL